MFSTSLRCVPSFVSANHCLHTITIFVSFPGIFLTDISPSSLDLMQSIFLLFPLTELPKMQTTYSSPLKKTFHPFLTAFEFRLKILSCPGYHICPVSPFLSEPYPITPDNWHNDLPSPLIVMHVCNCCSFCQNVLLSAFLPSQAQLVTSSQSGLGPL